MTLSVCVEEHGTVYSELQYCITPTYTLLRSFTNSSSLYF